MYACATPLPCLVISFKRLLSESGYLHKAVLLEKGAHIIEEIQVFKQPQPVKNLLLSIAKVPF